MNEETAKTETGIQELNLSKSERRRLAEQRKKAFEKRKEYKVSLAAEAGSRVMKPQSADTHRILNLLQVVDRGRLIISQNFMSRVGFGPEDITPLLENWNKALAELHRAGMAICEKAGVPTNRLKGWDEGKDIPVTEKKK